MNMYRERERIIDGIGRLEVRARRVKLVRIANILKKILTDTVFVLREGGEDVT